MGLFSSVKKAVGSVFGGSSGSGGSADGSGGLEGFLYSAGLNTLNAGVNTLLNDYASRQQWKYDKKLMNYQNQYNLPVNQRARLEEAGYNPNLALSGVNVQSASASAPQVKPSQIDMLQAYNLEQQNQLLHAQKQLTDENKYRAMTENLLSGRKANLLYYQDKYAEQEYETFKKTGKIPESYYKNMNAVGTISKVIDQVLQHFS